ncbi:MAG: hypothetical protein ACREN8_08555 [Candidatus Dormibacteraceae bacterium]
MVGIVSLVYAHIHGATPLDWIPNEARMTAAVLFAGIIAVWIYVATLIDWYYILPRVSGIVRLPPCRSSKDTEWITVTRVWVANRWSATAIGCIVCGAIMIGAVVYYFTGISGGLDEKEQLTISLGSFGTALFGAGVGVGIQLKLLDSLDDMLNPTNAVGDLVVDHSGMHYVVDASLQGRKVKRVESAARYGGGIFNDKGQLVKLKDVMVEDQRFHGCERACSGVNWYCDNNQVSGRYK